MRERRSTPFGARAFVKSAQRVIDILEHFAAMKAPASLSRLASTLGMPKSSCLALLGTLESNGYMYQLRPRIGYYPTRRWLDKAQIVSTNDPLIARLRPIMSALSEATGETVILGKRAGDNVMYIEVLESAQTLRYTATAGQFKPLYGTASGKALIAAMPDEERSGLLNRLNLRRLTPRTITNRVALARDIEKGIKRGWHISRGENDPDTTAIAVPVILAGDVFVLVIAGMMTRIDRQIDSLGTKLRNASRKLEREWS